MSFILHIGRTMFDSVLARQTAPRGKLLGAGLSAAIYAAIAAALLLGISRTRAEVTAPVEVKLFTATASPPPPPPPPPPPAGGSARKQLDKPITKKPVEKKPDTVVQPEVETKPEPTTQTADEKPSDAAGVPGGVAGGVPGGVIGGVPGGVLGGVPGGVVGGTLGGMGSAVLPFGAGMTRPQQIAGPIPTYTSDAIAARVEGKMLVRCVITISGAAQSCTIIKGLPMLNEAALSALSKSKWSPATFQGRAVTIQYVIPFNFKLP